MPGPGPFSALTRPFAHTVPDGGARISSPVVRNVWLIGIAFALLTIAVASLAIWDLKRRVVADAVGDMRSLGVVVSDHGTRYFQVVDLLLRSVQLRVQDAGVETPDAYTELMTRDSTRRYLIKQISIMPDGHALGLFDAQGTMIARGQDIDRPMFSIADRGYFRQLRDHPEETLVFDLVNSNRGAGIMSMVVARRINGPDQRFLGVAAVNIDIAYLLGFYRRINHDRNVRVTLLRRDGLILARYPMPEAAGRMMPSESGWFSAVAAGGGAYHSPGVLTGEPALVSVHLLPNHPLAINLSVREASVLQPWLRQAAFMAAAAAALTGVILTLFWSITRQIRRQEEHARAQAMSLEALRASERRLRENETRLDRAQEIAGMGSWEMNVETGHFVWSRHLATLRGYTAAFVPTRRNLATTYNAEDAARFNDWLDDLTGGRDREPIEVTTTRPDGQVRLLRLDGRAVRDDDGVVRRLSGTTQDITDRRLMERQLAQAQKMEAIASLTGGMAHDFNNVLAVIIGNLDLLRRRVVDDGLALEVCDEALDGATRCADLIRRLLAFARRQSLRPETVDLNQLATELTRLLNRVLGETITLTLDLEPGLPLVSVDPAQLQAAIINLAANARDAMPRGGQLLLTTGWRHLGADYVTHHPDVTAGDYAALEISDTGCGIPPDIIGRIFEPFFSTKEQGEGTGLGLSMVFGFIKQSGGHMSVYSEPGIGTTFRLYLPAGPRDPAAGAAPFPAEIVRGGPETVLLVEDNAQLRKAAIRQLRELGYQVLDAGDANAAADILAGDVHVDLLFSDVVMPGMMDGLELARQAVARRPGLCVLLTSGFTRLRGTGRWMGDSPFPLLNKPYRQAELAAAVRNALDRRYDQKSSPVTPARDGLPSELQPVGQSGGGDVR